MCHAIFNKTPRIYFSFQLQTVLSIANPINYFLKSNWAEDDKILSFQYTFLFL